ncbi:hypothetical protein PR202_gb18230 [Eleusine coracana subsp. coracana]|uniref:Glutaminyl-peptide cyclotransferase n=1 Tax=Eleusine coracana subsp. coracana TaxID=191504 RepID=A0AAV5F4R2_ELECO|nr:hypothetical protein PR202_gb18230 [Eleusine coracana subsp. coracana]
MTFAPPPLSLRRPAIAAALLPLLLLAVPCGRADSPPTTRFYSFDLVHEYPHDQNAFTERESFTHKMKDGWGLATDGEVLFGSDGTSTLYQLDPKSLEVMKMVTVRYHGNEVPNLNELEYVNGEVWANVYLTDCIAKVSPDDGQVVGWIFLHELKQHLLDSGNTDIDILNGIAWDEEKHRVFVTGKLWPKLYEIKLRPVDGPRNGSVEELCPKFWWTDIQHQYAAGIM